jgi:hypothetical protein
MARRSQRVTTTITVGGKVVEVTTADAAFQLLFAKVRRPHKARRMIEQAISEQDVELFGRDVTIELVGKEKALELYKDTPIPESWFVVGPQFAESHLELRLTETEGKARAQIKPTKALIGYYEYMLGAKGINGLLKRHRSQKPSTDQPGAKVQQAINALKDVFRSGLPDLLGPAEARRAVKDWYESQSLEQPKSDTMRRAIRHLRTTQMTQTPQTPLR